MIRTLQTTQRQAPNFMQGDWCHRRAPRRQLLYEQIIPDAVAVSKDNLRVCTHTASFLLRVLVLGFGNLKNRLLNSL